MTTDRSEWGYRWAWGELTKELDTAFSLLAQSAASSLESGNPATVMEIGLKLKEEGVNFEEVGYRRFSDFLVSAEKRGLIRILPTEDDDSTAIVLPVYSLDQMQSWFEKNVERLYGPSVNIPKAAFLKKIAQMLLETRTSLQQLESFLESDDAREAYTKLLESSGISFLPPFQMSFAYVLLGKGHGCVETAEKVNAELRPLGIVLKCSK